MTEPKVTLANALYTPQPKSNTVMRKMAAGRLMGDIIRVIEMIMAARGISRRELADRLGKAESTVSRQLDGNANLSVDRIADYFWALDDKPYLSSAGFDCLCQVGKAVDFRPIYDAASAPGWLTGIGVECHRTGAKLIHNAQSTVSPTRVINAVPLLTGTVRGGVHVED